MIVKRLLTPQQPFADDTSGFGYFATDLHYRRLAATICRRIAPSSGIVLVTGDPAPDGELLMACLNGEGQTGHRATLVGCEPGTGFDALVRHYSEQLGLAADEEGGNLWPLISHLMLESRKGVTRLLLVDNADALDDKVFDELYRFAKVDDPHLLPVLLLASSAFDKRINTPALSFLKPAIVAQLPLHHLDADEVAAFIHYQLNAADGTESDAFPPETIEAIAAAADGDPSIVNCLAREALAFRRRRAAATLAAVPLPAIAAPTEPAPQPVADMPAAASEAAAEPEAPAETAPETEPAFAPIDAVAAEDSAKKTTLIELAAIARQTESKPPAAREEAAPPAEEKPAPAAEADLPLELDPAATMAAKLAEPPSAKLRRSNTGLAAIAYLLLAAVSGSALLYLILPGASDRVPSNVTAEAAVPQSSAPTEEPPAATPVVLAAESTAASPSDAAASSAQPSLSPPPPPPESAMVPAHAAPLVVKHEEAPPRESSSLLAAVPTSQAVAAEPLPPPSPAPAAAVEKAVAEPMPSAVENTAAAEIAPPPAAEKTPAPEPAPRLAEAAMPDSPPAAEKRAAEPPRPTAERLAMVEPSSPAPALAFEQGLAEASLAPAAAALPAAPAPAVTAAPAAPVTLPAPVTAAPPAPTSAAPRVAALEPTPATAPASHAADRPPPAEIAVLLRRGDQLLAAGDIISARRFFELAATSGDPSASLGLAKSYDPLFLQQTGARGVSGKPADAAMWYRKAVEAGSTEASTRLNRLLARYPQ